MNKEIEAFRDGIFALRTRRFGNVAELMIQKLFKLTDSKRLEFDKYDSKTNNKIEVKFSTVMKKNQATIKSDNLIEECLNANVANRAIELKDIDKYNFDCNIQQIKIVEFDILYYGLFFADKILIFKINSTQIKHANIGYSDKQHRNNKGEGQFHITNENFKYHYDNFFVKEITYKKLYNLFKKF
ncbi:MAG: hypothetical protein U0J38_07560 [Bacteroidales bacterium]|nr:hypothetical protein [Bacteroidales bacterium]MEE1118639.1 hypothetical protein [Bacteroidales bacterium]MEE1252093.1 hypothetical protein [Bacteroidales bacterium]